MEIYHIINRGVDKRKIFINDKDYLRFIHDLFEFNDDNYIESSFRNSFVNKKYEINQNKKRDLLVYIHCFCLMPNHYHLLLSPLKNNAISKFMHKLNKGYSRYFNEKYERKGALFEGKYKKILIKKDRHFIHVPFYIHLNPLDLIEKNWRNRELKNFNLAIKFLENYRWSSHLDYLGIKNFPSVIYQKFILDFFDNHNIYKKSIYEWLKQIDINLIKNFLLE